MIMNSNSENKGFVAYEYKNINVTRDSVPLYEDCYRNFGWSLVEQYEYGVHQAPNTTYTGNTANVPHVSVQTGKPADVDIVTLKFKRDSRLCNKQKLDILQGQCEDAITAIDHLQKKGSAQTMGTALGLGIVGTGFLALAVYNFISASTPLGVAFTIIGVAGWGIGFLANSRIGRRKKAQLEPMLQEQFEIIHGTCEQAHAMLA